MNSSALLVSLMALKLTNVSLKNFSILLIFIVYLYSNGYDYPHKGKGSCLFVCAHTSKPMYLFRIIFSHEALSSQDSVILKMIRIRIVDPELFK